MSHFETLLIEYYEWRGYFVKRNTKVGKRKGGGWEMELDIIAYNPETKELLHLEPSLDAHSWERRQTRFAKKFEKGREYIPKMFKWESISPELRQEAILVSAPKQRSTRAGATVITIDEKVREIRERVKAEKIAAKCAISEAFPLPRTIQLVESRYYRRLI